MAVQVEERKRRALKGGGRDPLYRGDSSQGLVQLGERQSHSSLDP